MVALSNNSGNIVETYSYDVFGAGKDLYIGAGKNIYKPTVAITNNTVNIVQAGMTSRI